MSEPEGQRVLITGGAGGTGTALVWHFARKGARISILDRNKAAVDRLCEEVAAVGNAAVVFR